MPSIRQILKSYRTKFPPINFAIALFCFALIGIVWAATMERLRFERTDAAADAIRQNSNLAISFEEHTIRTLKGIDQALKLIKHRYEQEGMKLNIRKLIKDGEIDDSIFTGLSVIDENGRPVLGRRDSRGIINVADREYFTFHRQRKNHELFIGKPALGRVSGKWAIHMTRRINKPNGSFGGVALASVDPAYFTKFYQLADLGEPEKRALSGTTGATAHCLRSKLKAPSATLSLVADEKACPASPVTGPCRSIR